MRRSPVGDIVAHPGTVVENTRGEMFLVTRLTYLGDDRWRIHHRSLKTGLQDWNDLGLSYRKLKSTDYNVVFMP